MPPERFGPEDPREWLNRARSNLARARALTPGAYFEELCFDAQQAAEKAIKAVLIKRGVAFPYVHDVNRLLDLVAQTGEPVPESLRPAARLTRFAVVTRYPWTGDAVTEEEHQQAVVAAEAVVRWAEGAVGYPGAARLSP